MGSFYPWPGNFHASQAQKKKKKRKDLHLLKRENIYTCKFSKVNALRKERSGNYGQEETRLNLTQVKGTIKSVLVSMLKTIQHGPGMLIPGI